VTLDSYQIARNADWRRAYALTRDGAAVDLTGAQLYMQARRVGAPLELLISATLGAGLYLGNAAAGEIDIVAPAAAIGAAPIGDYEYDILVIEPGGAVTRAVSGVVTLVEGVTRR
jgi:hypothetical protein